MYFVESKYPSIIWTDGKFLRFPIGKVTNKVVDGYIVWSYGFENKEDAMWYWIVTG